MTKENRSLSPSEAAQKLGVSVKALRLYEQRALISPTRTEAGWRIYRPEDLATAKQVVSLRKLGLSLAQVGQVLSGDLKSFAEALSAHERDLVNKVVDLQAMAARVRDLRTRVLDGEFQGTDDLATLLPSAPTIVASFELPWPWDGETFDVRPPGSLNFIIGPLASGKTRFAKRLAEALPDGDFLGIDRLGNCCADAYAKLTYDKDLRVRVDKALNWLVGEGAEANDAIIALLVALEADRRTILVIDYIEQDLTTSTQEAFGSYLRMSSSDKRPLFVMTRSTAILDLEQMGPDERIILCPPNQNLPMYVEPYDGAPGYETVNLCLATPEARKRMEGVVAVRQTAIG